jgi:hypothetical protein
VQELSDALAAAEPAAPVTFTDPDGTALTVKEVKTGGKKVTIHLVDTGHQVGQVYTAENFAQATADTDPENEVLFSADGTSLVWGGASVEASGVAINLTADAHAAPAASAPKGN